MCLMTWRALSTRPYRLPRRGRPPRLWTWLWTWRLNLGPGRYCSSRHPAHHKPSDIQLKYVVANDIYQAHDVASNICQAHDAASNICQTLPIWRSRLPSAVHRSMMTWPLRRGLHSSSFSAQRKHLLWDTLGSVIVSLSVTETAQVEWEVEECKPLPLRFNDGRTIRQGLKLVHFRLDMSTLFVIRWAYCVVAVTETAQVEPNSGRVEAPAIRPHFCALAAATAL